MRWQVVNVFNETLNTLGKKIEKIGVLGGSSADPEVAVIKRTYPEASITYLGIDNYGAEENWENLDLNYRQEKHIQYDLVVCSQVLEHLWNLSSAFESISKLTKINGFIWINCPTSNIEHGSPSYYSAGYSPDYLKMNFEKFHFLTLISDCIGSERYYKATHLLRHWSTEAEHKRPVTGYRISNGVTLGKIKELILRIPGRLLMLTWSKSISQNLQYATETYYFGQKTQDYL